MPNHVTNELQASKDVIDFLRGETAEGEELIVDFNRVIPMPAVIAGTSGMMHIDRYAKVIIKHVPSLRALSVENEAVYNAIVARDWKTAAERIPKMTFPDDLREGWLRNNSPEKLSEAEWAEIVDQVRAIIEYGAGNWYDWSIANWGTKWNAYSIERRGDEVVRFETAWSAPLPVIEALSEKFPEERIRLRWADEDFGSNTGDVTFEGGKIVEGGEFENCSREANVLAFELVYGNEIDPEYHERFDPEKGLIYKEDG